jgi:hypothetical protein
MADESLRGFPNEPDSIAWPTRPLDPNRLVSPADFTIEDVAHRGGGNSAML